jgi:hypothetical protein
MFNTTSTDCKNHRVECAAAREAAKVNSNDTKLLAHRQTLWMTYMHRLHKHTGKAVTKAALSGTLFPKFQPHLTMRNP